MTIIFNRDPLFDPAKYRYVGSTPTLANEGLRSLWFKPDGTKVYYMGTSAGILRSYVMSTPWDITTVTNAQSSSARLVDTGSVAIAPRSMVLNSSGTILLVGDSNSAPLYKYTLSNAWDVTSINVTASEQTTNSNVTGANSIWLGNNDTTLVIHTTGSSPSLKVNTISSSLDFSTITLNSSNSSAGLNIPSINFVDNGNRAIIGTAAGSYGRIEMYNVSTPYQWIGATLTKQTLTIGTKPLGTELLLNFLGTNGLGELFMTNDGQYLYAISSNAAILKIHMWTVII